VELAIVAAVGLGLWLRGHKVRPAHVKLRAGDQDFVKLRSRER
jgi:hypothetical protein